MIKHIRKWNIWRKYCLNSWPSKLRVLFGIDRPPTFHWLNPDDENISSKILVYSSIEKQRKEELYEK